MAKDIKTREKSHHTIKKLDKSIAYTSRIKRSMLDNYKKSKKNDRESDEKTRERNYATDKVIRVGEKATKEAGYVITDVAKYAYKKAKFKILEKRLKKKEEQEEQEGQENNSSDKIKTRDSEVGKNEQSEDNTNYHSNSKSKSNLKNELKDNIEESKNSKIQDFQKKKMIKEKQKTKNIKTHDYRNNDVKINKNTMKIRTRENINASNDTTPLNKKMIDKLNPANKTEIIKRNSGKAKDVTKKVEKGIVNTGKSMIRGLKSLTTLLIAGGSGIIMFVLIIVMIGGILKSTLGFFFTDDSSKITGNMTIGDSIDKLEDELDEEVQEIKSKVDYDKVVVNKGDIWWKDIITMYAVIATNRENMDITTMNEENYEKLKEIFNEVVDVDYETSTYYVIYVHTVNGQQVRERQARTRLEINIKCMTFDEMVGHFAFSVSERNQAIELLQPQYDAMWEKIFEEHLK